MQTPEINHIFEHFNTKKAAIIGDVMIDSYLWGNATRISPEAPVPIVSITKRESRMGGAANVAVNIKALGATPFMMAVVGNDKKGHEFIQLMQAAGINTEGILLQENRKTTVKHRVIASNQHLLRIDDEMTNPLQPEDENHFIEHCIAILEKQKPDIIIFEDYDKGNITPLVISEIVKFAQHNKITTMVDPKKRNFNDYKNVTLFKPNYKEMIEGLKIEPVAKNNSQSIFEAANALRSQLNATYIMVTLSEYGIFVTNGTKYFSMPAQRREIADVSGAGDTVISVAALALSCGLPMENFAAISNIAGGLVCEKAGVVPVDKEQLLKETILYYLE